MESVPTPDSGDPEKGVVYGTSTEGMVKFFRHIGYHVRSSLDRKPGERIRTEEEFQNWVLTSLKAGAPIMVEWLDWSEHWAAIIGYDSLGTDAVEDDVLILADPYDVGDHFQDGYHIFPAMRFFYMWRDIRYEQGTDISEQQWLIAAPRG
jgi:hypothetical protein